ncbi:hypothetical protein Patl1_30710 [Pistacia atlantica]|uniref:Uncharacterized protein n=1 Tax=Pistacia atlantica TaxID=434234 RepID=A0ACC1AF51_9ROSI|nr:hypothetical protein Patl1_30710 [Pistacia atlantica]
MGNSNSGQHRGHYHSDEPPPPRSRPTPNQYVFAAATPYPAQYPNSNRYYHNYPSFYRPPPVPAPTPYGTFHHVPGAHYPPMMAPYVEHQKAVTIRNDVNVKKESLRVEPDHESPGKFLVSFTFDATAPGSISVMFLAKEEEDCNLIPTKEDLLKTVTISFQPGLGQKFRQPSGTGIDFLMFDETTLTEGGDTQVYPLIVKAEACPSEHSGSEANPSGNSQITMAVFEKREKAEYQVRVIKQILWVNNVRYELQEIYGIGNTVSSEADESDSGKDCVICLSEPRDTTVLPCRHMCMCSGCAKVLQFQSNRCPICRQPVDRLLEIKEVKCGVRIQCHGFNSNAFLANFGVVPEMKHIADSFQVTNSMASSPTETLSLEPPINGHDSTNPNQPDHNADDEIQPSVPLSTDGDHPNPAEKRKREEDPLQNSEPDPSLNPLWKTSLCSYFRTHSGHCRHGSACRYAHGEEELRPRPDNTWDPTSQRAKKAKQSENGEKCEVKEKVDDVMMTEVVVDGDGDGGGGEDSELSKCLVHLPRKWSSDNLKKFLAEHEILFKSAKKKKGMTVGFVNFGSTEQLSSSMEKLEGISVGNKNLKVANVIPRSFEKKVKSAMAHPQDTQQTDEPLLVGEIDGVSPSSNRIEDGNTNTDSSAVDGSVSRARSARDVVTPLAHMPYTDQLEHKRNSIAQMLKKLTRNARKACPNGVSLPQWIIKSREIGGLPCQLEGILESPLVNGYRNKCEFSVGYSLQGKPTVGFMLGNFREGVTAVEEPVDCPNVSTIACKYASVFQEFLQHSDLPIWNRFKNIGFWRQLAVREGRTPRKPTDAENLDANTSEVMLIVQVCSTGVDDSVVNSEFEKLAQAFAAGATATSPSLPLTALVVQDHQGISNVAPADAPLRQLTIPKSESGTEVEGTNDVVEARIHDCISDLRFCISPTAFFQVNTLAAEKLYSLAGDWADLGPDTLLFDVCCGTGTIGLTLAHRVGMVIGIEMNASAVSDAHRNAEINGIKNCKFVCAKAEDVMGSLLREYLNVPQKQDEHAFESNDKETATTEENDSSVDNVLHSEGSSGHEPENGVSPSECSESGGKEPQNQVQKSCTSEDENSFVQQFKNVVAIVDPPRGGLHPTVIKALRTHPHLRRLVYISCNPETLVANAIELCTPSPEKVEKGNKDNRGWRNMSSAGLARHRAKSMPVSEPFQPVKAMAVDLFPHTSHCEMVMLLER